MKKTITILIGLIVVAAIIIVAVTATNKADKEPDEREVFAQCIAESGATFFGAFWCPHCISQKEAFGRKATKLLPYVECSTANRGQNQVCQDENIQSYPTWEFADGSRMTGDLSFLDLAQQTGCPLPSNLLTNPINNALEVAEDIETASAAILEE